MLDQSKAPLADDLLEAWRIPCDSVDKACDAFNIEYRATEILLGSATTNTYLTLRLLFNRDLT